MFGGLFSTEEKIRFEFKIKIHDIDQVELSLNELKLLNKDVSFLIQLKKAGVLDEKETTAHTAKSVYKRGRITWEEEMIIKTFLFKDKKKQFFEPKKISLIFESFEQETQKKQTLSNSDVNLSEYANLQDEKISFSVPFKIGKNIPMLNLTIVCRKILDETLQETNLKRNGSFFTLTMPKKEEDTGSSPRKRSTSFLGNLVSPRILGNNINSPHEDKKDTPRIIVDPDEIGKEKKENEDLKKQNEELRKENEALKKTEALKEVLYSDLESKYLQLVEKLEFFSVLESKVKALTIENDFLRKEIENLKK